MRFLIILIFLCSSTLYSIDVTHYTSEFGQITGMHQSKKYGLLVSNSSGVYKIDTNSGKFEVVPRGYQANPVSQSVFFEYLDELHSYRPGDQLLKIKNGTYELVSGKIVAHLVVNDKLYLLRAEEPRIQILQNGIFKNFD
ncbi:MAG: hypothetical protein PF588_01560, partial [Candidatus Kapabacteria bacterium]|nr:hypothetical protein [Candidatus Kapabacteria bacterium]